MVERIVLYYINANGDIKFIVNLGVNSIETVYIRIVLCHQHYNYLFVYVHFRRFSIHRL
jgi:hypothetical protein